MGERCWFWEAAYGDMWRVGVAVLELGLGVTAPKAGGIGF